MRSRISRRSTLPVETAGTAGISRIRGWIRFQDTCALWTALNSFAALEDLVASLVKQARNVVNFAMDQTVQPVPSTFFPPKYRISAAPIMESTRYSGGRDAVHRFAFTAACS